MKARPLNVVEIRRRIAALQRSIPKKAPITVASLKEAEAREAIESRRGTPYSDSEWDEASSNLRAFFGLLGEWSQDERIDA